VMEGSVTTLEHNLGTTSAFIHRVSNHTGRAENKIEPVVRTVDSPQNRNSENGIHRQKNTQFIMG